MPIPESQLTTWARPGATSTAKNTHEAIRRALDDAEESRLREADYQVYLQGSYPNDTNTRGDSDVDVVAQLDSAFVSDTSRLTLHEQRDYKRAYADATYGWSEFRADVLAALRDYFGAGAVVEGNNAIHLRKGSGRLGADIVPCVQYRKYRRFTSSDDDDYVEGILFYNRLAERVVNFPKPHYRNGVAKNGEGRTGGRFKPVVRMFKNARSYLVDHGEIGADLAPSYFLQCLLYNVPDRHFGGTYQDSYRNILTWLRNQDLTNFICQNGEVRLFGSSRQQWSAHNAGATIDKLIELWDDWYE
jgi:hypothetical protein